MGKLIKKIHAFNRGIVSRLGLSRTDIERISLSAETQTNWMPRVLGSMMLRPGLGYLGTTKSNLAAKFLEFVYASDDTAAIELTEYVMRVWVNDALITRPTVSTAVTNSTFSQYSTTVTITSANPGVFTYAGADSFAEGNQITFTTTGVLPTNIVVGTTYYVKVGTLNTGANTFQVALTPTGTAIDCTAGTQSGVHTVYYLSGWIDADEAGAVSAQDSGTYNMGLTGTSTASAIRYQILTIAGGDQNVRHAIKIVVARGTCVFKVGSTLGGNEYVATTTLGRGEHSLSFVPTGATVYVQMENVKQTKALITLIIMATPGVMEVTTPWAASDMANISKPAASADVLYIACKNKQQMKIERRATYSWSVVYYEPEDGPFLTENITATKLTPSALTGNNVLLTATNTTALFKSTDIGRLIQIRSIGQKVSKSFVALDEVSESIRVTAVGANRTFAITITGTWAATITLQRSVGDELSWVDVASYTTNQSITHNDTLDNQIVYYRLKATAYTSGTALGVLNYSLGSSTGVARIVDYQSGLVVYVDILDSFGSLTATNTWSLGIWSNNTGWPTATEFRDGRLWWSGKTWIIGSVSDGYSSFDSFIEGNSAPIIRTIGFGPVDVINWLCATHKLFIGTSGAEIAASSSSLEEAVTNSNFNLKVASSHGSKLLAPVIVDTSLVFVQRGGSQIYEIDAENQVNNLTTIVPDLFSSSIVKLAVQRVPDTRIHAVRTDGKVGILIYDKIEKVFCWVLFETDGVVEDVIVLPGAIEDAVYYVVKRVIGGADKRYFERWALETEARGGVTNKIADSFIAYSGASTATITGLNHLEGKSVIVWGNSKDLGTYTVASGSITLSEAVTLAYVGLTYQATYKSAKVAPLTSNNRIDHIGLNLLDTHAQGLEYGQDFTIMDSLPLMEGYGPVATGAIWDQYDEDAIELPGEWGNDSRLCLRATAPRPCTVSACIIDIVAN